MSVEREMAALSEEELMSQGGTALPDKEVASILDLNADLNLGISASAPIDLGVAANANVAAPIGAGASANVLSVGSESQALADQGTIINQGVTGNAAAHSVQDSAIDQGAGATTGAGAVGDTAAAPAPTSPAGAVPDLGAVPAGAGGALNGNLLNVAVNLDANAGIAAPINGAVAANANVAAPIDAAVGANIGSIDSNAFAVAQQDAIINQDIHGDATASADQQSDLKQ
jgi:hypothetical protein